VRIYIISNGGYLLSCTLAFGGYFVYRHLRPDEPRPFRLPTAAKWGALGVFIIWTAIYFFGGWNSPKVVVGPGQGPGLYLLGLLIVALYAPLYWWRRWQDRRLAGPVQAVPAAAAAGGTVAAPVAEGDGATVTAEPAVTAEPSAEPPAGA
jgi:amino acid transporter